MIKRLIEISAILLPLNAAAQDLKLTEPNVGNAVASLKKGEQAPFNGILFSPGAAADMYSRIDSMDERIKLNVEKHVAMCVEEHEHRIRMLNIKHYTESDIASARFTAAIQRNDVLTKRIQQLEDDQVEPMWYVLLGTAAGALTTGLIISIVK